MSNTQNAQTHRAAARGSVDVGWLKSHHSFSFGSYFDPEKLGFGQLRVLNDDIVEPGKGFPEHPHRNMEIISIPLSGSLEHKDSRGNIRTISTNEVQVMSAGTGITHSEYNGSTNESVNFLQIWVVPNALNTPPSYHQKEFIPADFDGQFAPIVSNAADDGGLPIKQEAKLSMGKFQPGRKFSYKRSLSDGHGIYLFLVEGSVEIEGMTLNSRDAFHSFSHDNVVGIVREEAAILALEVPA